MPPPDSTNSIKQSRRRYLADQILSHPELTPRLIHSKKPSDIDQAAQIWGDITDRVNVKYATKCAQSNGKVKPLSVEQAKSQYRNRNPQYCTKERKSNSPIDRYLDSIIDNNDLEPLDLFIKAFMEKLDQAGKLSIFADMIMEYKNGKICEQEKGAKLFPGTGDGQWLEWSDGFQGQIEQSPENAFLFNGSVNDPAEEAASTAQVDL